MADQSSTLLSEKTLPSGQKTLTSGQKTLLSKRKRRLRSSALSVSLAVVVHAPGFAATSATTVGNPTTSPTTNTNPTNNPTGDGACIGPATVASWPFARQAGQVLMFSLPVKRIKEGPTLVRRWNLAGLLVRGLPTKADANAIRSVRDAKRNLDALPAIVAVDEEGGKVQHLRAAVGAIPGAPALTKLTPEKARSVMAQHGRGMKNMGFTMNFGPVVDLSANTPLKNGLEGRTYSADPAVVAQYAGAFADGMTDAGIVPVLKHFPGHGNAVGNSHFSGAVTPDWTILEKNDVEAFRGVMKTRPKGIGIMTGHLHVPGFTNRPASLAKPAISYVRDELGFDGLVVTDSLSMRAVRASFSAADVAVEALIAGNDLLLFDEESHLAPVIVDRIAQVAATDKATAIRLVNANLRVLRAAGANVCAGSLLASDKAVVALTSTGVPNRIMQPSSTDTSVIVKNP